MEHLSFVVLGASGDLACRKIYPALFSLYLEDLLPANFTITGFARSAMSADEFRKKIGEKLTCRVQKGAECDAKRDLFLSRLEYQGGQYDSLEDFKKLNARLSVMENTYKVKNRIFYMAVPPSVFLPASKSIGSEAMSREGYTRVIIEKPFGRDLESSNSLMRDIRRIFSEEATYRIDHYLGKELVQNLMVLRFANLVFEPLWNRSSVASVQITFKEKIGIEGRGGYFEDYGIIRDVMQNHLMQILALVAMEVPVSLESEHVRDEKVKVLRMIRPLKLDEMVAGQYKKNTDQPQSLNYHEERGVKPGSQTPTYAAAVMFVKNRRWDGVPFLLRCGKALDDSRAEIRIQFHHVPGDIFSTPAKNLAGNELVIRVQPDEAIYLKVMNKVPGLSTELRPTNLDLRYKAQYEGFIPDAYERLVLDVIKGDKSLFIRDDELEAAWKIFTPVLHESENNKIAPVVYDFGSRGPAEADYLAARFGVKWRDG